MELDTFYMHACHFDHGVLVHPVLHTGTRQQWLCWNNILKCCPGSGALLRLKRPVRPMACESSGSFQLGQQDPWHLELSIPLLISGFFQTRDLGELHTHPRLCSWTLIVKYWLQPGSEASNASDFSWWFLFKQLGRLVEISPELWMSGSLKRASRLISLWRQKP